MQRSPVAHDFDRVPLVRSGPRSDLGCAPVEQATWSYGWCCPTCGSGGQAHSLTKGQEQHDRCNPRLRLWSPAGRHSERWYSID